MKNSIWSALAAVLLAGGCADDTYKGNFEDGNSSTLTLPVRISVGNPFIKGSVSDISDINGKSIYVYAFRKNDKVSYKSTSEENRNECLIDGSPVKEGGFPAGKAARVEAGSPYAAWSGKGVNWPAGDNHRYAYDFFAYYLGGAELKDVIREDDCVKLKFSITGKEDVMVSKAVPTASQLSGLGSSDKYEAVALSFSHFTALRSISPVFTLKHQLVKLDFEIAAGQVEIEEISVLSGKEAELTVAHKNESEMGISFTDDVDSMSGDKALGYAISLKPSANQAMLLAAPSERYRVFVKVKADGVSETIASEILNPVKGRHFASGENYKVKLTAKGVSPEDLTVETTLG